MSITFTPLDEENRDSIHKMSLGIYLDGCCYEFAAALNRDLGWPLYGLMTVNPLGLIIRHAVAKDPRHRYWDIRGPVKRRSLGSPFDLNDPLIQPISLEDMRKIRPVDDGDIDRASLTAQALWPELPWLAHTLHARSQEFLVRLTDLCRKHGVWIRAPYPAAQVVLSNAYGDEKGFKLSPTLDGQYFFDRML
ncbi:hypothetical protein KGP36_04220 [Patescibacteria group bacterium]|nr:hypothetical protein [Patescibacteria group bacterium]